MNITNNLSDYIVYVDESGDHSLESINSRYPLFVLSFCIFQKRHYSYEVTPALRMIKFSVFGHDMVVLHEHEIRKKTGIFNKLGREAREGFLNSLSILVEQADFTLIPIVIDKVALKEHNIDFDVYHLAMRLGLEKIYRFLRSRNQHNQITYVVFEARGQKEDLGLKSEFQNVCDDNNTQKRLPFEIVVADKKTNSEGLQFADLVARPVGLSILRPEQPNRAFAILKKKLYPDEDNGSNLEPFVFPIKAKDLKVSLEAQAPVG